jgi:acyl-CoA reductase-like NAD-dependent aldehyde dehydrogenase
VVLKHASQTLLVGERLAEAFHAGGVPADVFQNVVLDHATTESLIAARSFGFVNFTGSVAGALRLNARRQGHSPRRAGTGRQRPRLCARRCRSGRGRGRLMDGAMFNAGQCCCGIERIYVHESLYDAFVEKAVALGEGLKLGNPFDAETTLGPMAHARFARGARPNGRGCGGGRKTPDRPRAVPADDGGAYLAPQILVNVDHSMRVMREESFGPVVGIMPVKDDAEAIRLMNDSPYGLTASIWTQDPDGT